MSVTDLADDREGEGEGEGADETICVDAPEMPTRTCRLFVPPSDIDACVRFSTARMLVSAFSLLLALTDIPRTGLGLSSLKDYFNVVGLDTVMYFGPYAYPVAHFSVDVMGSNSSSSRSSSNSDGGGDGSTDGNRIDISDINASSLYTYRATFDGDTLESVDAWAYKFDSLSISTRALAQHLDVKAYPRCLLTAQPCASSGLGVRTAFVMLDELIAAFTARYVSTPQVQAQAQARAHSHSPAVSALVPTPPLVLATKSLWIDRLHQFLVKPIRKNLELRTHVVQHFGALSLQLASSICDPLLSDGSVQSSSARPLICDAPLIWLCDRPDTEVLSSKAQVPIWDHIALRVAALQRQYPGLELDLTTITSRLVVQTRRWRWLPAISFTADTTEITTLVRGRECVSTASSSPSTVAAANSSIAPAQTSCRTVFIDDYRYERATCVSDADQWFDVASALRAVAQCFVWLRFALLWVGCYCARAAESKFARACWRTKLYHTALTVAKIPSHVIVYGSWFPISCYVLAHYLDSALIHLISATVWSTINGVVHFEPIKYVRIASIQMRNIWLAALLVKLFVDTTQRASRPRQSRWTVRDGVVGVRAILFGIVSSLTVFSCLRARRFRDASIIEISVLPNHSALQDALGSGLSNDTLYGIRFDLLTLAIAACVVAAALPLVLVLTTLAQIGDSSLALTCHSYLVPHSAEGFWPRGSLITHWRMTLVDRTIDASMASQSRSQRSDGSRYSPDKRSPSFRRRFFMSAVFPAPSRKHEPSSRQLANRPCDASCKYRATRHSWWHVVQGCPHHDSLVDVSSRSKGHWSAVRIMNIAMMTDPIVLIHLYAVGRQMLIYCAKPKAAQAQTGAAALDPLTNQQQLLHDSATSDSGRVPSAGKCTLPAPILSPSTSRLYVCPSYVMGDTERTVVRVDNDYFRDYELLGSTNSALLPWTVLVNSG